MQDRLNQLFAQKELTATKFAAMIGVSASTISHILAGRNKPGFDIINSIAEVFPDISLTWLITGKGPMYTGSVPEQPMKKPIEEPLLFKEEEILKTKQVEKELPEWSTSFRVSSEKSKNLKRILLFFDDGSFEDYNKE
ncbi:MULTISPECIES: helix-turn-helix domain-containing protein [Sanguibacteroides]|uniref:helix-turn-helix domain-containing protein n=1 Tax=Sanguibacteroides TaxID=1635148 RepID=UPI000697C0F4|nr:MULTISPECIES: helix-turn-helix domain-containing protein [Sanguibacteroides]PXZ45300.1 XRE family transcriptional regulator [Sanguibacteroides justesenii]